MIASVIYLLIYVCLLALAIYLVLWVVRDVLQIPIPERVVQILWVIVALVVLLLVVQTFLGDMRVPRLL